MSSPSDLARSGTLEELYGKLDRVGMGPGWNKPTPSLWPAPRKTLVPAHWQYELARGALDAAGRLINTALAELGMGPGWNKPTPSLWPAPRKTLVPAHWQYELARGALDAAGRLINTALA